MLNSNCMYSSMPLLLVGDNSLAEESSELFLYLSLKNSTIDSNLKNKEDAVKRETILNCQNVAWSSLMCILGLFSAIKGKIISHYPDSGDTMQRLPFNQAIFPRIKNLQ